MNKIQSHHAHTPGAQAAVGDGRRMSNVHAAIDHRVKARYQRDENEVRMEKITRTTEADLLAGIHSSLAPGALNADRKSVATAGTRLTVDTNATAGDGLASPASATKP